jgi:hydrogenase maturation protease
MKTLLFGIGNSGRQDDGLGWAFAEAVERAGIPDLEIHYRYQLQVEDAELLAQAGKVIFVDAHRGALPQGFLSEKIEASSRFEFTSHLLLPASLLFLTNELFGKMPEACLLLIGGEQWGLETGLGKTARQNLQLALAWWEKGSLLGAKME